MEIFYGSSMRPGIAIAVAARMEDYNGVQMLNADRLRLNGERIKRMGGDELEPEQVVLIGQRVPTRRDIETLFDSVEVVGIATVSDAYSANSPDCPTVSDLSEDILESIPENEIVILDGDRGRIYVSPDAMTVARFQSPLNASRRIHLDSAHLPAHTASTNTLITVLALVPSQDAIKQAMEAGADGIVIPSDNDFFGVDDETSIPEYQKQMLSDITETIAGLPIFLHLPSERLSLSVLAQSATHSPIHLLIEQPSIREELDQQMRLIEMEFDDEEIAYRPIHYHLMITVQEGEIDLPESLNDLAGLIAVDDAEDSEAPLGILMMIGSIAQRSSKSASIILANDTWQVFLDRALEFGFTQVIVPAEIVPYVKEAIRQT